MMNPQISKHKKQGKQVWGSEFWKCGKGCKSASVEDWDFQASNFLRKYYSSFKKFIAKSSRVSILRIIFRDKLSINQWSSHGSETSCFGNLFWASIWFGWTRRKESFTATGSGKKHRWLRAALKVGLFLARRRKWNWKAVQSRVIEYTRKNGGLC